MNKIYRNVEKIESDGRLIRGLAVVVGSWSKDLGGFRELILPEAVTDDLIQRSDVMLCLDHDPSKVMARSRFGKGSLRLSVTPRGLEFETEAPNTTVGRDTVELLKRGDYSQCSFCFTLPKEGAERWYHNAEGQLCREISAFDRLWDVSIVYDPAYDATTADVRSKQVLDAMSKLAVYEKEINNIYV